MFVFKLLLGITSLLAPLKSTAQFTCSPTQPCDIGCCTQFGSCGLGPDSCGPENCISDCDRKSDCDPGWGTQWSTTEACPLNVCCSKFGFCGTTSDFCGNVTVNAPSCSGSSSSTRTMGYYEAWSITRPCDKMYPESIPMGAYTHLNFAFAFIDPTTFEVAPMSVDDPALYTRFTALKNSNPGLQTWISIGGWSMNDPEQPTATTFSDLAGSTDAQSKFFASTLSFLETYGFDGVDIDWEYPGAPERSGKPADFENYVSFLQNLRNALHSTGHNYGLTITIPSSFWYLQHFDIVNIAKIIDWFNLMSYDLHGTWDSTDKFIGPLIAAHTNLTEIDEALSLLWRNNIDPTKVTLGLGFYGRSFTLADPNCATPGCIFTSGAPGGECTQSVGTLSFAEIQRIIAAGATVTTDTVAAVKMVVYDTDQWVSYDDADTFKLKIDYANNHCLGGTMVWAASTDDVDGTAASALSVSTGRTVLSLLGLGRPDPITSCQLGDCGQNCPAGLSPAQRNDGNNKGNTGTDTGCSDGQSRLYCCPSNDMPTCTWRGKAPFCGSTAHCTDGEVEVSTSTTGTGAECWTSHKVLCCLKTSSDAAASQCEWTGSAPFCSLPFTDASCNQGQTRLTEDNYGSGGEQPCSTGNKAFCCDQPVPYQNCAWVGSTGGWFSGPVPCTGSCPAGKTLLATDPTKCSGGGFAAFCCDNPLTSSSDPIVADFKRRIESFASDPTCAVGQRQYSRRDVSAFRNVSILPVSADGHLDKRAGLNNKDFSLTVNDVSLIARKVQTYQQNLMAQEFNATLGVQYNLFITSVGGFFGDWPEMDPLSLTESLLCLGTRAANFLDSYHTSRSQVCVNPCTTSISSRDYIPLSLPFLSNLSLTSVKPRNLGDSFDPNAQGPDGEPSWAFIAQAILNGQMTLEYEQIIYTRSFETILEVVWNLPSGNGLAGRDPNYQDRNPSDAATNPDRYAVFHFHTEHILGGFPGIYAIVAFHGQAYTPNHFGARVNGNDNGGRNRRARILECNTGSESNDDTFFWYPGHSVDSTIMTSFGTYLRNQGILTADTFTGGTSGGLALAAPDHCGRQNLVWPWQPPASSRQFGPNGTPPPNGENDPAGPHDDGETDNDGVAGAP